MFNMQVALISVLQTFQNNLLMSASLTTASSILPLLMYLIFTYPLDIERDLSRDSQWVVSPTVIQGCWLGRERMGGYWIHLNPLTAAVSPWILSGMSWNCLISRVSVSPQTSHRAEDGTGVLKDYPKRARADGDAVHAACDCSTPSHALPHISPTWFYFPPNSLTPWLSLLCSVSSPNSLSLVKENQSTLLSHNLPPPAWSTLRLTQLDFC